MLKLKLGSSKAALLAALFCVLVWAFVAIATWLAWTRPVWRDELSDARENFAVGRTERIHR